MKCVIRKRDYFKHVNEVISKRLKRLHQKVEEILFQMIKNDKPQRTSVLYIVVYGIMINVQGVQRIRGQSYKAINKKITISAQKVYAF